MVRVNSIHVVARIIKTAIARDNQGCAQADKAVPPLPPIVFNRLRPQPVPRANRVIATAGVVEAAGHGRRKRHNLKRRAGRVRSLRRPVKQRPTGIADQCRNRLLGVRPAGVKGAGVVAGEAGHGQNLARLRPQNDNGSGTAVQGSRLGQRLLHRLLKFNIERGVNASRLARLRFGKGLHVFPRRAEHIQHPAACAAQIGFAPRFETR